MLPLEKSLCLPFLCSNRIAGGRAIRFRMQLVDTWVYVVFVVEDRVPGMDIEKEWGRTALARLPKRH